MSNTIRDRTFALAGVFQACYLVDQIATKGMTDSIALEASVKSIFQVNPETVEKVYGDAEGVATGLSVLVKQLSGNRQQINLLITRYVVAVLHLAQKLLKQQDRLEKISQGIANASTQAEHYHITHDNVLANLAETYKLAISTLAPRIMVQGEHGHLSNPGNANKVRALLLSGIRSAVLFRQCGGNRWQVLFNRRAFINEAEKILSTLRD